MKQLTTFITDALHVNEAFRINKDTKLNRIGGLIDDILVSLYASPIEYIRMEQRNSQYVDAEVKYVEKIVKKYYTDFLSNSSYNRITIVVNKTYIDYNSRIKKPGEKIKNNIKNGTNVQLHTAYEFHSIKAILRDAVMEKQDISDIVSKYVGGSEIATQITPLYLYINIKEQSKIIVTTSNVKKETQK